MNTRTITEWRFTGFEICHSDGDEVRAKLTRGQWRAYEVEHVWGYSHLHGGQCHHERVRVLRDIDGAAIQAATFEELLERLRSQRFLQPSIDKAGQVVPANRY